MRMYRPLLVLMIALPLGCQSSGSLWGGRHTANELVAGTGDSSQKDAQLAAAEAAQQALGAMGQTKAKLVLVFDQANAADATLKGVNSVFDPNIVFGCTAYSPLTEAGNNATVGVLALGGDIEVQVAMAKVDGSHQNCGRQIGRQIKQTSPAAKREGELMILFGSCHEPTDDQVVAGVRQELGDTFPVVGAAAAGSTDIYYQGKAIKDVNVGVVIRGDFHCDFAMKHAEGDGKDKLVQSAISAVQQVRATRTCGAAGQAAPALLFIFDCGGRRGQLGDRLQQEFDGMKASAGGAKMFGFYGSGEIGKVDNGSPARGVAYHVAASRVVPHHAGEIGMHT